MALVKLLGEKLKTKDGVVSTANALKGKKAVAIYFSAHWCPPCRGFTPKLAEAYKGLVAMGKSFEVVFISSDHDEKAFESYYGEQPWLAQPYAKRKLKAALSKKYGVTGIPSLIILDGETGELITRDGRRAVMEDIRGDRFPWRPPTVWEAMGDEFMSGDGEMVELSAIRGEAHEGKVIGLYFSAHWCPPCTTFTPLLVKTYEKLKADGKVSAAHARSPLLDSAPRACAPPACLRLHRSAPLCIARLHRSAQSPLRASRRPLPAPCLHYHPASCASYLCTPLQEIEVVFVSSDKDMGQFQEYFATMPWLAIPPGDKRKAALSKRYEVEGIPTLVLLDGATGKEINANAKGALGGDPVEGCGFPWRAAPKALRRSTGTGAPCVIM